MDKVPFIPLDIIQLIGTLINDYSTYASFIVSCKSINLLDKNIREVDTIEVEEYDPDYANGALVHRYRTFKGLKTGQHTSIQDGKIVAITNYHNGFRHGASFRYESTPGRNLPISTGEYFMNIPHGIFEHYSYSRKDGKYHFISRNQYVNGILEGISEESVDIYQSIDNSLKLNKYSYGICITTTSNGFVVSRFKFLELISSKVDFDHVIDQAPEFMYELYFEMDNHRFILEVDDLSEIGDEMMEVKSRKIISALNHGYEVVMLDRKFEISMTEFLEYIYMLLINAMDYHIPKEVIIRYYIGNGLDGDVEWLDSIQDSNNIGLISTVNSMSDSSQYGLSSELSKLGIHIDNLYSNNIESYLLLILGRLQVNIDKSMKHDDKIDLRRRKSEIPLEIRDAHLFFKPILEKHHRYNMDISRIHFIYEYLINQMNIFKINTKLDRTSNEYTLSTILKSCYLYGGFQDNHNRFIYTLRMNLSQLMIDELHAAINNSSEYCGHDSKDNCDSTCIMFQLNSVLDSYGAGEMIYTSSTTYHLGSEYNDWKLNKCLHMTRRDIHILERYTVEFRSILKRFSGLPDAINSSIFTDNREELSQYLKVLNYVTDNSMIQRLINTINDGK